MGSPQSVDLVGTEGDGIDNITHKKIPGAMSNDSKK
jgi:hypothetical protein